jgi:hypothetical protein
VWTEEDGETFAVKEPMFFHSTQEKIVAARWRWHVQQTEPSTYARPGSSDDPPPDPKFGGQRIRWIEPKERSVGELYEVGRAIAVELKAGRKDASRKGAAVASAITSSMWHINGTLSRMHFDMKFGPRTFRHRHDHLAEEAPDLEQTLRDHAKIMESGKGPLVKYYLPNGWSIFWQEDEDGVIDMWVKDDNTGERYQLEVVGYTDRNMPFEPTYDHSEDPPTVFKGPSAPDAPGEWADAPEDDDAE